jgi:DNA ligase 4
LSKAIADSLNLTKDNYLRLHHYKNPSFHKNGVGIGDFSLCVHDVIKGYSKEHSTLTVGELNAMLDGLIGSSRGHLAIFRRMFTVCTAEEIKWIIRIILKDLKINVKIDTVLNAFHPDAHDYFNLTNSLHETCKKFEDPSISLDDEIKVFFPIRPMLAGKKKINYFQDSSKVYYVETKYDGERLQAHKKGTEVKLFSRNAVDYSKIYE